MAAEITVHTQLQKLIEPAFAEKDVDQGVQSRELPAFATSLKELELQPSTSGHLLVLDGQQRLSALATPPLRRLRRCADSAAAPTPPLRRLLSLTNLDYNLLIMLL